MRNLQPALIFGLCLAAGAGAARAATLEFVFSTTVDATDFGLSASEPITIRYRYDPITVPLLYELGTPVVRTAYAPVEGRLLVGDDVVLIQGELALDDENSGHDAYDFVAASFLADTSVSGSVNGTPIRSFELYFLDQSAPTSMLGSFVPPATTNFADQATLVRVDFRDSGSSIATRDFAPAQHGAFSFSVPEPPTAWQALAIAPLAALAARRRRR
jgi:hypothetical protein